MQIDKVAKLPFETLHVDHFGPLPEIEDSFKYILVVVDAFSRFTWFLPTCSTTSKETCEQLQTLFNIFGTLKEIVSDRGTAFTAYEFTYFLNSLGIKHRKVAVASPWANGLAERANRFLRTSLVKTMDKPNAWKQYFRSVQYVINNTVNSSVKSTPCKVLLGYEQRNHSDSSLKDLIEQLAKIEIDIEKERQHARDVTKEATDKIRNYNKIYYDNKHRLPSVYTEGDFVLIRDLQTKPGQNKKFKAAYKGPYMIVKALKNNRYVVSDIPGFNLSPKPYNTILSPDKLKPWKKKIDAN